MDFAELHQLLARKNQRFICRDLGWPEPGPERLTAHIFHEVSPPLDEALLEVLAAQLPEVPRLIALYAQFGSIRLYCDANEDPSGFRSSAFYIAHPDEWEDQKLGFQAWLEGLSKEEEAELLPAWIHDEYLVIGEIPHSGNAFLVPLCGPETGSVIEFEHDGFEFITQGDSIDDFIASLCVVTDSLLHTIGCHTRYYDGRTDTQWLPERYEAD